LRIREIKAFLQNSFGYAYEIVDYLERHPAFNEIGVLFFLANLPQIALSKLHVSLSPKESSFFLRVFDKH
jgi:hypothetical protein